MCLHANPYMICNFNCRIETKRLVKVTGSYGYTVKAVGLTFGNGI